MENGGGKSLLIAFNFFPESHTTDNIQTYINNVLEIFNIPITLPLITYCAQNMIKLGETYPLVVCFAHRLHTVISSTFESSIKTNEQINAIHKNIIELIKYINKASNLKPHFKTRLKQGGTTRT